jgi:hypothetical protein
MTMPSMGAEYRIAGCQMGTNPGGDRLLSDVGMACPVDQPALMAPREFFFGLTDDLHRAVQIDDLLVLDTAHTCAIMISFSDLLGNSVG